jgi:hypothetical protein
LDSRHFVEEGDEFSVEGGIALVVPLLDELYQSGECAFCLDHGEGLVVDAAVEEEEPGDDVQRGGIFFLMSSQKGS